MPETWFISDTHFGHANILGFEPEARPFKTVEEMNEAIIDNWNRVVSHRDTVYHMGDFCFGRQNICIAERLKGQKRLVLGNHDSYPVSDYLRYFDKIYGCKFWNNCILTHIPVHARQFGDRCVLNVHGHLHSKVVIRPELEGPLAHVPDENYFNVSCEQNALTPINADVIRAYVNVMGW